MKKNIALILVSALALSMSACGVENAESENPSSEALQEQNADKAAEKTEKSTTTETTPEETTTSEETTVTEAEVDNKLYAYYDLISAEYKKYGDSIVRLYDSNDIIVSNNLIYFWKSEYVEYTPGRYTDSNVLYSYNIDSKELKKCFVQLDISELVDDDIWGYEYLGYHDGLFYFEHQYFDRKYLIKAVDETGKLVYKVDLSDICEEPPSGSNSWQGNGYISFYQQGNTENKQFIFTPELEVLPNPTVDVGHGITEPLHVNDYAYTNGKLYAGGVDGNFYYYDETASEWKETVHHENDYDFRYSNFIGKYCFNDDVVYNLETAEKVAEFSYDKYSDHEFFRSYFGGSTNIVLHDDAWYKVQFPSDGSKVDYSKYEPISKETSDGYIYRVNDKYYLLKDNYGLFLRTYEKGEEEEDVIFKNEQ